MLSNKGKMVFLRIIYMFNILGNFNFSVKKILLFKKLYVHVPSSPYSQMCASSL